MGFSASQLQKYGFKRCKDEDYSDHGYRFYIYKYDDLTIVYTKWNKRVYLWICANYEKYGISHNKWREKYNDLSKRTHEFDSVPEEAIDLERFTESCRMINDTFKKLESIK